MPEILFFQQRSGFTGYPCILIKIKTYYILFFLDRKVCFFVYMDTIEFYRILIFQCARLSIR